LMLRERQTDAVSLWWPYPRVGRPQGAGPRVGSWWRRAGKTRGAWGAAVRGMRLARWWSVGATGPGGHVVASGALRRAACGFARRGVVLPQSVIGRVHDPGPGRRKEPGPTYPGSEHAPWPCLVACLSSCSLAHARDWFPVWISAFSLVRDLRLQFGPPAAVSPEPGSPGTQTICVSSEPGRGALSARA